MREIEDGKETEISKRNQKRESDGENVSPERDRQGWRSIKIWFVSWYLY